jgi:hypothetical protein
LELLTGPPESKLDKNMDQLSREKAELLLEKEVVVNTKIEQDKNEMRIFIELADGNYFLVKYDLVQKAKSYFFEKKNLLK